MNLKPLASNMTEMTIGDNKILFSYKTPVAIQNRFGVVYKTQKHWSSTTSRHINKWLISLGVSSNTVDMPQEYFDNLLNEVK